MTGSPLTSATCPGWSAVSPLDGNYGEGRYLVRVVRLGCDEVTAGGGVMAP